MCIMSYKSNTCVLQNPGYMKEGFKLVIETLHVGDRGNQDNVSFSCISGVLACEERQRQHFKGLGGPVFFSSLILFIFILFPPLTRIPGT
jgi:hypothetical protein